MSDKQVSAAVAFRAVMQSGRYLAVAAVVFLLLAAVLPVATLSARLGGTDMAGLSSVAGGSVDPTGSSVAGLLGWLAVLAFAAAAASRFVTELAPFRSRLDVAAFSLLPVAVVWSVYDGPLAVQMRTAGEVSHMMDTLGGHTAASLPTISVSATPALGCLFVLLAPVALLLARRREAALRTL